MRRILFRRYVRTTILVFIAFAVLSAYFPVSDVQMPPPPQEKPSDTDISTCTIPGTDIESDVVIVRRFYNGLRVDFLTPDAGTAPFAVTLFDADQNVTAIFIRTADGKVVMYKTANEANVEAGPPCTVALAYHNKKEGI